ncbi:MAG TPA: cbb3-type cytochrome c oxidase subunit 3 [Acidiferrobacterales bacterium]|jgi:cytochrome c oxidase cbb3-type subunit 4
MNLPLFHAFWTVLLIVIFVGIWIWAWSGKRKSAFDKAARAPLEDDHELIPPPPGSAARAPRSGEE